MYRFSQKINNSRWIQTIKISLGLGRIWGKKGISCIFLVSIFSGCTSFRQTIGIDKTSPKELAVQPYEKALEVPPCMKEMPKEQDQCLENGALPNSPVASGKFIQKSVPQNSQPVGGASSS